MRLGVCAAGSCAGAGLLRSASGLFLVDRRGVVPAVELLVDLFVGDDIVLRCLLTLRRCVVGGIVRRWDGGELAGCKCDKKEYACCWGEGRCGERSGAVESGLAAILESTLRAPRFLTRSKRSFAFSTLRVVGKGMIDMARAPIVAARVALTAMAQRSAGPL